MKKSFMLLGVVFLVLFFGCKGEPGPVGPTGAPGVPGTPGTPGDSIVATFFQKEMYPSAAYTGVKDSYIGSDSYAGNNYGTQNQLFIGLFKIFSIDPPINIKERILLNFDLSILSGQNITIKNASLILYCEQIVPEGASVNITPYRLTEGFTETEVTWMQKDSVSTWTTPGGTYNATPIGNKVAVSAENTYYEFKLDTTTVKNWIDAPADNFGLILIADEENNADITFAKFHSSNYSDLKLRPKLIVNYTINP